ncbi:MAG: hypothetical protein ACP5PX_01515 [Candidatus Hadarchaeum sp.]|uniref:hypothetical protein n=1 Tax=Candidatus Hadarchaeum sp. TaxID=2883567 RepID=UPI003D0B0AD1
MPASNGKNLFVTSDFDRKLYVWKSLPDQSGAFPDIVYSLQDGPSPRCGRTPSRSRGRKLYIWRKLPLEGDLPDTIIQGRMGSIAFQDLKGVALDDRYFYLADYGAEKVYVWEGLPDENLNPSPKFTLNEDPRRLYSEGEYLSVDTIYDHSVKIYRVAEISNNAAPVASVGGPGRMNGP